MNSGLIFIFKQAERLTPLLLTLIDITDPFESLSECERGFYTLTSFLENIPHRFESFFFSFSFISTGLRS